MAQPGDPHAVTVTAAFSDKTIARMANRILDALWQLDTELPKGEDCGARYRAELLARLADGCADAQKTLTNRSLWDFESG